MQDPSLSHSRPRFGWRWGTLRPSRRQIRSTRLWFAYLAAVTGAPKTLPPAQRAAAVQTLFVVRAGRDAGGPTDAASAPEDALFVLRGDARSKP